MNWIGMTAAAAALAASTALAQGKDAANTNDVALVQRVCVGCHAWETVTAQGHTAQEWGELVDRMVDHGASASDAELAEIKAYLARTLPPAAQTAANSH